MNTKKPLIISLIFSALFFAFLYIIRSILSPFIVAIVLAYFLNPLVNKLQKFHLSRAFSVLLILTIFIFLIVVLTILILPVLYNQTLSLIQTLPDYTQIIFNKIYPKIYQFSIKKGFVIETDINKYLTNENFSNVIGFSGTIIQNIMHSGILAVNLLSLLFITPILLFYTLKDWNLLVEKINRYLPSYYSKEIRDFFKDVDQTLSGYIRGQFNVCIILGAFYAVALSIFGLNFGFLIGFLTGFLSFIPYVGMLSGVSSAIVVGLFQFGFEPIQIGLILLIFLIGQIAESNFLTPKLIGDKIGLHPVFIIFGLFVFAVLFGFIGILFAMPATAISGVIIKLVAKQYKKHHI